MRRPSEAQFVVFSLKSFVQDLVGPRIKVFHMAIIAGANQDRDPAVDVSFVAPLPKCHFFHALCHAPLFAARLANRIRNLGYHVEIRAAA
jgi:hypothetical protein